MGTGFDPWRHAIEQIEDRLWDLALTDLAQRTGISVALLGAYLGGRPIEQPGHRRRIAEALGWESSAIDALLAGEYASDQPSQ